MRDLNNLTSNLAYDETFSCVQCGYCLPACPTYKTMEKETHSPRGRINLVKMAAEGKISLDKLKEPIDLCLGCRACERVCPTNVQYGTILESAKEALQKQNNEASGFVQNKFNDIIFKQIFPSKRKMNMVSHLLWFYQKTGLKNVAHATNLIKILPENLRTFENITPIITSPMKRKKRPTHFIPNGKPTYTVAFFTGCVMDAVFEKINDLSMKLLKEAGCEVITIPNETCCGALHAHAGEIDYARKLAKDNITAFEHHNIDFIVNNAGGCGAMLKEYDHLLKDEPEWHDRAKSFVEKSVDISVILSQCTLPFKKNEMLVVTYQPSCHMTNVQKVKDEPLTLIKSIPGITLKRLKDEDMCCGSAGIYNIVNYEESMKILDEKMQEVKTVTPEVIITTNPGCLLQMKAGIEREKMKNVRALHLVELLAEACNIN